MSGTLGQIWAARLLLVLACLTPLPALAGAPSAYQQEIGMGRGALIARWTPMIAEASARFGVPVAWIRAVMLAESGGRTMAGEGIPITSQMGAMGLMQIMPQSWQAMRSAYGLGDDPFDPHDNILAGTAILRLLYDQYGYPGLFAAYNDGPGMVEAHRQAGESLPDETVAYVARIARILRRRESQDMAVDPKTVDPMDVAAGDDDPPRPVEYPDDEDSGAD